MWQDEEHCEVRARCTRNHLGFFFDSMGETDGDARRCVFVRNRRMVFGCVLSFDSRQDIRQQDWLGPSKLTAIFKCKQAEN